MVVSTPLYRRHNTVEMGMWMDESIRQRSITFIPVHTVPALVFVTWYLALPHPCLSASLCGMTAADSLAGRETYMPHLLMRH